MIKVLVVGPGLTRTGYGEHCRFVLRSLRDDPNLELFFVPRNWGQSGWVWENSEERQWLDSIIEKTAQYQDAHKKQGVEAQFDFSVQVTIPNEWQRLAPINVGVTAGIETTKVAPVWLEKANMMDHIVTISEHSKQSFVNTKYEGEHKETGQRISLECKTPIDVVHYPVKKCKTDELDLALTSNFNFLTVAQWGPRKNLANTITWFVEEFIDNPGVGLVVKTFQKGGSLMDRLAAEKTLKQLLSKYENRQCKIYLLHGDMSEEDIHSLYKHPKIKALVSLSHGEGFGLPHFEAAYSGLPVIAADWSGYLDFLCMPKKDKKGKAKIRPHFATVEYDISPIPDYAHWEGVLQKDSMWAYPQQGAYKMRLREMFKDHGRFKSQAKKLQKHILKNFEENGQLNKLKSSILTVPTASGAFVEDTEIDDLFNKIAEEG